MLIIFLLLPSLSISGDEPCSSKSCSAGPAGNTECQNYGYCNSEKKVCCLGHYKNCTSPESRAIRPRISCKNHEDCEMSYCDQKLGICCSEGHSPEGYCPNNLTFYGIEPTCKGKFSRTCSIDSYCYRGHCCPRHKVHGSTVARRIRPYYTNRKCSPYEAPPFRYTFCTRDTNRLAILGMYMADGSDNIDTERYCGSNRDCSSTSVCVFTNSVGTCFVDPMFTPEPLNFYGPLWIALYTIIPTTFLIFGLVCGINFWKKDCYYAI